MFNQFTFNIPCIPTAQARVRYTSLRHIAYKSKNQLTNEKEIESLLQDAKKKFPNDVILPITYSVGIEIEAILPIPKSTSNTDKDLMVKGFILPEKKPDIDNLIKQLLDAMTRMNFWKDDKQVITCSAIKYYGLNPSWKVKLFPMRSIYDYRKCLQNRKW